MAFGSSVHAPAKWFHKERLVGRTPDLEDVHKVFDTDSYAQPMATICSSVKRPLAHAGSSWTGETLPWSVASRTGGTPLLLTTGAPCAPFLLLSPVCPPISR